MTMTNSQKRAIMREARQRAVNTQYLNQFPRIKAMPAIIQHLFREGLPHGWGK